MVEFWITLNKYNEFEIGDVISDMHYGIDKIKLDPALEIIDHTHWLAAGGSKFIEATTNKRYTNKMAVVVSVREDYVLVNYSCDDYRFGVFKIAIKK